MVLVMTELVKDWLAVDVDAGTVAVGVDEVGAALLVLAPVLLVTALVVTALLGVFCTFGAFGDEMTCGESPPILNRNLSDDVTCAIMPGFTNSEAPPSFVFTSSAPWMTCTAVP